MAITGKRHVAALAGSVTALAVALSGCAGGSGTSGGGETKTITWLVDNTENTVSYAEQIAEDFTAANPNIKVEIETRPQGGEGDNIVKTRLSTGDMADVFSYNSGSLFHQIGPEQNLVPVTNEPYMANVSDSFKPVVKAGEDIYGGAGRNRQRRRGALQQESLRGSGPLGAQDVVRVHGQQPEDQGRG